MSDLAVTAASVVAGSGASIVHGTFGETVTAGQAVVKNPTTGKYVKSDSNSATAALRSVDGIALNGGAADQPCAVQKGGEITIGATLTANTPYALSDTAGGLCPLADVGSGEYFTQIGIAKSTSVLILDIRSTGVAN